MPATVTRSDQVVVARGSPAVVVGVEEKGREVVVVAAAAAA
jgi:hypothetical protein